MGMEIERKFLVRGDGWRVPGGGTPIRQGYLSSVKERIVRARTMGERAFLTIKGMNVGATRPEFEYEIPFDDARQLLELCEQPLVEKTRYVIPFGGLIWEVDEFHGVNDGLVIAECELVSEDQEFEKPGWVGDEVTGVPRYYNANLITRPFSTW